jgi:hypothetical protein
MANLTIAQLTAILGADLEGIDLFPVWDDSAAETKKISLTELLTVLGIANWSEAFVSGTQATSSWTPDNAAANVNAAIIPKGTGAIVASIPDGTAVGGNSRGAYSLDLQRSRTLATQVASGDSSTLLNTFSSVAAAPGAAILSGFNNTVASASQWGIICGGGGHTISISNYGFIGGGFGNTCSGYISTIGGGQSNSIGSTAQICFIGGGNSNAIAANVQYATIGAGNDNDVTGNYGSVLGGQLNKANASFATTVGGYNNFSGADYCVTGGGYQNANRNTYGTICGGSINEINGGSYAFIGGGTQNRTQNGYGTVCGGFQNYADSLNAFIGGGDRHRITGQNGTIGGGGENTVSGSWATIAGGYLNTASGNYSQSGGRQTTASGEYSFAFGQTCVAAHPYSVATGLSAVSPNQGVRVHSTQNIDSNIGGSSQNIDFQVKKSITGTSASELWLSNSGIPAAPVIPTGTVWHGQVDCVAICKTQGDGTTVVGDVYATSYLVTIKNIGGATTLVGTVQQIGTANSDATMSTSVFSITANDPQDQLKIDFTPPATAGSTTVIYAMATLNLSHLRYTT